MDKKIYVLSHEIARDRAVQGVRGAPDGFIVEVRPASRSGLQNSLLWAALTDVANQVEYFGKKYSPDAWKNIFSGSLKAMEAVPAISGGGVVMIGQSTSNMTKRDFSELIELIFSFGAENGVRWSDSARVA